MYVFLVLVVIAVIGSMGWLTLKSGRAYRATMAQSKQESPEIINRTQIVKDKALANRDRCIEAVNKVSTELQVT